MPTSPFTIRPTVLSLPLLIFILSLFVSTSIANNCQCACCFGNFCAPSIIGTDSVTSCNACTDDFCTSEYPASCPTTGESGGRTATCASGFAIWVIMCIRQLSYSATSEKKKKEGEGARGRHKRGYNTTCPSRE